MKLLVRCREHIGDIVNSTAALQAIRRGFPSAHITIEVGEGLSELVEVPIFGDRVITRRSREGVPGKLRSVLWMAMERFDSVIVLDESRRLMLEAFLAGIPRRYGIHRGKNTAIYTTGVEHRTDIHECRGNFDQLLMAMGVSLCPDLHLPVRPEHTQSVCEVLASSGVDLARPLIGLNCARPNTRQHWPVEQILALASMLEPHGLQLILTGGKSDVEFSAAVKSPNIVNVVGRFSLLESAAALGLMDCYVSGDTGPMHVAAAMGTHTICLYAAGSNPIYTGPWGSDHVILTSPEPDLRGISPELVLECVERNCRLFRSV